MEDLHHLNYLAIFASAVVYMILGFLWYSPALFGNLWMDAVKIKKEEIECRRTCLLWGFLNALVISFGLAFFLYKTGAVSFAQGSHVALLAWVAFVATTTMSGVIWERKSLRWWLIVSGFGLIALQVISAILIYWK